MASVFSKVTSVGVGFTGNVANFIADIGAMIPGVHLLAAHVALAGGGLKSTGELMAGNGTQMAAHTMVESTAHAGVIAAGGDIAGIGGLTNMGLKITTGKDAYERVADVAVGKPLDTPKVATKPVKQGTIGTA